MPKPEITIIIPTLNEAANIGKLLRHLHSNSNSARLETLVVDANSADDTAKIARELGARVLSCQIGSRAAQMNLGAREAQSEILYFVHADTLPPISFVEDILAAMRAGQVMGCYRYQFDSPRRILRFNAYFVRFPWLWCQGGDKTFFIKKEIFDALGGYDERFVVMEEYDFLRRAMPVYPLRILPKNVLVSARKYQHNSWLRVQVANLGAFTLFRCGVAPVRIKRFYCWLLHL